MKLSLRFLFSAGLGAAAMYYFDPDRGPERRARLRDRLQHGGDRAPEDAGPARPRPGRARPPREKQASATPTEETPDRPTPAH